MGSEGAVEVHYIVMLYPLAYVVAAVVAVGAAVYLALHRPWRR